MTKTETLDIKHQAEAEILASGLDAARILGLLPEEYLGRDREASASERLAIALTAEHIATGLSTAELLEFHADLL